MRQTVENLVRWILFSVVFAFLPVTLLQMVTWLGGGAIEPWTELVADGELVWLTASFSGSGLGYAILGGNHLRIPRIIVGFILVLFVVVTVVLFFNIPAGDDATQVERFAHMSTAMIGGSVVVTGCSIMLHRAP